MTHWWAKHPGWLPYRLGECSHECVYMEEPSEHQWIIILLGKNYWWESTALRFCKHEGCEELVGVYPCHWDERLQLEYGVQGTCPEHCPDHEYEYDSGVGRSVCKDCGGDPPYDYYDWDYD